MSKLIEFEEEKFKNELVKLNEVVNSLNRAIPIIAEFEEVTLELFYKMITDIDYIRKERYHLKIKELCEKFYLEYEEVSNFFTDHFIKDMASGAIQYLFKARGAIKLNGTHKDLLSEDYIIISDGIASKTPNAEQLLKDKYSHYTENKRELEVFEKMTDVNKLLNEISKKYGYQNIKDITSYNSDEKKFEINRNVLKNVANRNR